MRISDWSSDVCSSDLFAVAGMGTDPPVQTDGQLERHQGAPELPGAQETCIQLGGREFQATGIYRDIGLPQQRESLARDPRVGIFNGDHATGNSGPDQGFGADRKSTRLTSSH